MQAVPFDAEVCLKAYYPKPVHDMKKCTQSQISSIKFVATPLEYQTSALLTVPAPWPELSIPPGRDQNAAL